jgi:hypothetical protein
MRNANQISKISNLFVFHYRDYEVLSYFITYLLIVGVEHRVLGAMKADKLQHNSKMNFYNGKEKNLKTRIQIQ